MHRGDSYPVVQLSDALGASSADDSDGLGAESQLIRIDNSIRQVALECDSITRTKEVVVDPYDGVLSRVTGLSGAVVLGQDNVVNVLDLSTL
jgi:chemotaxis protein histidine kinase CheA